MFAGFLVRSSSRPAMTTSGLICNGPFLCNLRLCLSVSRLALAWEESDRVTLMHRGRLGVGGTHTPHHTPRLNPIPSHTHPSGPIRGCSAGVASPRSCPRNPASVCAVCPPLGGKKNRPSPKINRKHARRRLKVKQRHLGKNSISAQRHESSPALKGTATRLI